MIPPFEKEVCLGLGELYGEKWEVGDGVYGVGGKGWGLGWGGWSLDEVLQLLWLIQLVGRVGSGEVWGSLGNLGCG